MLRDGRVETLVGTGLFDWGADDGDRSTARLQHPLGVAALAGGAIAVADTFNSLLRIWASSALRTLPLLEAVDEPGGLDVLPDGRLVVADTNHHRVITVDAEIGAVAEIAIRDERARRAGPGQRSQDRRDRARRSPRTSTSRARPRPAAGTAGAPHAERRPADTARAGPRSWALDALPVSVDVRLGRPGAACSPWT